MPLRLMTAAALVGGAGWTYATQEAWSRAAFLQAAAVLWFAQFALYSVWELFLYPTFFSPLRNLPTPSGSHWLLGHGKKILADKPGAPMREW